MLLTSGQVSAAISSVIVFTFTSILFLSGLLLQRQTVADLRSVLAPDLPVHSSNTNSTPQIFESITSRYDHASISWSRYAHVQVAHDVSQICACLSLLISLSRQRSCVQRVFAYPEEWEVTLPVFDRIIEAARTYRLKLVPLSAEELHGYAGQSTAAVVASLGLEKALHLETPGLALRADSLDELFLARSDERNAALVEATKRDPLGYLVSDGGLATNYTTNAVLSLTGSKDRIIRHQVINFGAFLASTGYVVLPEMEGYEPGRRKDSSQFAELKRSLYRQYRLLKEDVCAEFDENG